MLKNSNYVELKNSNYVQIKSVSINFFAPYHGKSHCDAHFGNISFWVDYYSKKWKDGIIDTNDVVNAIDNGCKSASKFNDKYNDGKEKDVIRCIPETKNQ